MDHQTLESMTPRAAQEALAAMLVERDARDIVVKAAAAYLADVRSRPTAFIGGKDRDERSANYWAAVAWTYHPHICSPAARASRHTVRSLLKSRIADEALDIARTGRALDEKTALHTVRVDDCYALDELLERLAYNAESKLFTQREMELCDLTD